MGIAEPGPAPTRAEIDLAALAHNYHELRRITSPAAKMMAVVKADAYGHGAVRVSQVALACGAEFLAVARLSEAVELRRAGINAPILLFGYANPADAPFMAAQHIRASIDSLESATALSQAAQQHHATLLAHLKIDTGMGRLGLLPDALTVSNGMQNEIDRAVQDVLTITQLPGLRVEGVYTHFAKADSRDISHAQHQFVIFMDLLTALKKHGFEVELRHAANSAATIAMPETHLDMVRPGIAQYGLWPSDEMARGVIDLRPVMTVKSTVIQIKDIPPGFRVSYGCTWESTCRTRIATIPIGYADGYRRLLSSQGSMLIRGQRAPIVGRVCMDLTMLDVGHLPAVATGDEVVVLGEQGDQVISADEIAALTGTINYEIVSAFAPRIPRIYSAHRGTGATQSPCEARR